MKKKKESYAWVFETIILGLIAIVLFPYLTENYDFIGFAIWMIMMVCIAGYAMSKLTE